MSARLESLGNGQPRAAAATTGVKPWVVLLVGSTVIVLAVLVAFRGFLAGATTLVLPPDGAFLSFMTEYFFASQLKAGLLPLWNPHDMSGFPTYAYPQYGAWYPIRWLFWLWPYGGPAYTPGAFGAFIVLHTALCGVFMFLLVRTLGLSVWAGIVAGLLWALAPNTLVYAGWNNALPGLTWWPATLACIFRSEAAARAGEQRGAWGWVGLSGLSLGMVGLAIPAQLFLQLIAMICLLFVFLLRPWAGWGPAVMLTLRTAALGSIGVAVAMISLAPALDLTVHATRFMAEFPAMQMSEPIPLNVFTHYGFGLEQASGFIFADRARATSAFSIYVGAFAVIAAIFGVASFAARPRAAGWFAAALVVLSTAYMFVLVLPYIFYHIPGLNLIRQPAYYASGAVFGTALLAAYGVNAIVRGELGPRGRAVAVFVAAVLCAGLAVWATRGVGGRPLPLQGIALLVGALAWAALAAWRPRWSGAVPGRLGHFLGALAVCGVGAGLLLNAAPGVSRTIFNFQAVIDNSAGLRVLAAKGAEPFRVGPVPGAGGEIYPPNIANVAGFYDTFGFHNPVITRALQAHLWLQQRARLQTLLNVRYIVTSAQSAAEVAATLELNRDGEIPLPYSPVIAAGKPYGDVADLVAIPTRAALGHAWLVNQVDVVPDPEGALSGGALPGVAPTSIGLQFNRVLDPSFDPARAVVVERMPDGPDVWNNNGGGDPSGTVTWAKYRAGMLEMQVTSDRPAMLVVSEVWSPGWKAKINGAPGTVYRANGVISAVIVPKGRATVTLEIAPTSFRFGAALAIVAIMIGLTLSSPWQAWPLGLAHRLRRFTTQRG